MYVQNLVYSLLTDTKASNAWKLQELQKLLYRSEKSRDDNKRAIEALEAETKDAPDSKTLNLLEANRHDFELYKREVDLILEAIHSIKNQTSGTQLELFS